MKHTGCGAFKLTLIFVTPYSTVITPPTPLNDAPQGGFFLSNREQFQKPAIEVLDQIKLLQSRGLAIPNIQHAEHYLKFIGYYRLSGYFRYYTDPKQVDVFYKDATFERVLDLYIFDRRMRSLVLDALERIEVAVKAAFSHSASTSDSPFWMCEPTNFNYGQHQAVMKIIAEAVAPPTEKQKHVFLTHFYTKYADPYPPSWMLMETFSFGAVSKIYKIAKGAHRIPTATLFGLQHDVLESWLHALVFARNVCAHHCRLWNRTFTIKPKIPKNYRHWPIHSADKLYVICGIIQHMMNVIADDSKWDEKLENLIDERPNVPLAALGFPEDWKGQSPWT